MKYFLLFLVVAGGYIYYQQGQLWNDEDLAQLITQKNQDLCSMPELLETYKITEKQCAVTFVSSIEPCLAKTDQLFPGEEFETKAQLLEAFNGTMSCIVDGMGK